jgi:pyruvate kinase
MAADPTMHLKTFHLPAALAKGVWHIVRDLAPKVVVVWSRSGATAQIFSSTHFPVPIIALSSNHKVLRRMALHYGVLTKEMEQPPNAYALINQTDAVVQEQKYAEAGDQIVIVSGGLLGTAGAMDSIILHTVGQTFVAPAANPNVVKEI